MGEPTHFKNEDTARRFTERAQKQFVWLIHKHDIAKTEAKKQKILKQIKNWMNKHPVFIRTMENKLRNERPDIVAFIKIMKAWNPDK